VAVELFEQNAARLQHTRALGQVAPEWRLVRQMLHHRIGIDEIEAGIREGGEIAVVRPVQMRMRDAGHTRAAERDHLVGDVDAMDFAAMRAERCHQPADSAGYFEETTGFERRFQAREFLANAAQDVGPAGREFLILLPAAPEGDVVPGILACHPVPGVTHALCDVGEARHTCPLANDR
jgi:hypothetical protein